MEWVFQAGIEYDHIGFVDAGCRHRCKHAAQTDSIDEQRGGGAGVDTLRYQDRFVADLQTVPGKIEEADTTARKTRVKRGERLLHLLRGPIREDVHLEA